MSFDATHMESGANTYREPRFWLPLSTVPRTRFYFPWDFWVNYNDLTRPHPKWWFMLGIAPKPPCFRLVKYHNSPRNFQCCLGSNMLVVRGGFAPPRNMGDGVGGGGGGDGKNTFPPTTCPPPAAAASAFSRLVASHRRVCRPSRRRMCPRPPSAKPLRPLRRCRKLLIDSGPTSPGQKHCAA